MSPATASPTTAKHASCASPVTPLNQNVRYATLVLATPVASVGHNCFAMCAGATPGRL